MKLVIAEKPSVANEIAKVIGAQKKENGYLFGGEYCVSWCVGHLIETVMPQAYDETYEKWRLMDLPIIPKEWKYSVSQGTQSQFQILQRLMENDEVDEIICATDAGREGELIFRLVYNQVGCKKPFKRLWISSMETKAIKEGFEKMKDGSAYDNLYAAALARLQADWLVGINFSRLFGCMSHKPLNVGRVQTPTVNLIVERQKTIDNFDATPYYTLTADCDGFSATKRVDEEEISKEIIKKCKGKPATVASLSKAPMKENPSALYDLTTLQREANKMLGLSAQQTLDAAQNLYEKKLLTYPRTDSRFLTADMKETTQGVIDSILSAGFLNEKTLATYDKSQMQIDKLINDKKVTDHHAIIPTMEARRATDQLPKNEFQILLMVAYKLLSAAYIPHEYVKTDLVLTIEGEEFKASGRQITEAGFKEVQTHLTELLKKGKEKGEKESKEEKAEKEDLIPPLEKGEEIPLISVSAKKKTTQPPKAYTEDTLLSAMENAMKTLEDEELKKEVSGTGLGTPATRAGIIERIIKTEFVERKGKNLLPTQKAYDLVEVIPDKVKSAILTAEWEQKMDWIYKGEMSGQEFISGIESFVSELVESYKGRFDENGKEIIGKCPRCGKNIYEGKQNYYCESGKECNFTIWKSDKFFESKKKELTKPMVAAFLKRGWIQAVGLYSEQKDTTYDAYIIMEDTGTYVNFKVRFQ